LYFGRSWFSISESSSFDVECGGRIGDSIGCTFFFDINNAFVVECCIKEEL
jgi:hypothetical protein